MSEGKNSLITLGLGELAKPAEVLIEKISSAIGWIAYPYQIKRVANAEAEASLIKAKAQIEVSEIEQRGLVRMIRNEGKKQENIEKITFEALKNLNVEAKPNDVDNDWIANFFDKCETVSDTEMQSLWAKILAGEVNKPGSFSKRTVNSVASLDKHDAHLFTTLCRFCWMIIENVPIVFDYQDEIYTKHGISFDELNHLDSVGLITFTPLGGYGEENLLPNFSISYYGTSIKFSNTGHSRSLNHGKVLLTKTGKELAPICGSTPIDGFIDYVVNHWKKEGYIL